MLLRSRAACAALAPTQPTSSVVNTANLARAKLFLCEHADLPQNSPPFHRVQHSKVRNERFCLQKAAAGFSGV